MTSSSTLPPPTSLEQMESRLAELELQFGTGEQAASPSSERRNSAIPTSGYGDDANSRLVKLMRLGPTTSSATAASTSAATGTGGGGGDDARRAQAKRLALHEEFLAIDRLLSDLAMSPAAGPAAASSASSGGGIDRNPPMAYRRMEVLASAESMRGDMELLTRIRDLTSIGAKAAAAAAGDSGGAGGGGVVANCPIITSGRYDLPSDPAVAGRLERLCHRAAKLSRDAARASRRADAMLTTYGNVMMALNEKMVLAEEQLEDRRSL